MTPRQPDRDQIRPSGANSLLETGNMRFGCDLFLLPQPLFLFPEKEAFRF